MSGLGPWAAVVDDVALRLERATGAAAAKYAHLQHGLGLGLRSSARDLMEGERVGSALFDERSLSRPGARGALAPSDRFGPFTQSPLERHVGTRRLTIDDEMSGMLRPTSNGVWITRDPDGALYIYKPSHQEFYGDNNWLPHENGQLAIREVAGYRVFERLAPARVPPTALVDGPRGPGMAQLYVPLKRGKSATAYLEVQRAETAMGHFLIGNADGSRGNFRPRHDGDLEHHPGDDLVVYDLGHSFPESPDPLRGSGEEYEEDGTDFSLYSPFIDEWAGEEFPRSVVDSADGITPDWMGSALEDLRFSDDAIDRALERLDYVHRNHTIYRGGLAAS
ncbi:MAG: hypothetical protein HOQ36_01130 [Nocardia sp.]|nr:hypothetical protein [Nocardia sp.]